MFLFGSAFHVSAGSMAAPRWPPQLTLLFLGSQKFLVGFLRLQTLQRGLPVAKIYKRSAHARFASHQQCFTLP